MPSADNFYWNVSNFSTIDNFLSDKKIEDTSANTVKGIIGLFIWKEEQLQEYLNTKLECANDDDRMQLWMLNAALFEHKSIIHNSHNRLQDLKWGLRTNIETHNNIDFRINSATAYIKHLWSSKKEYVLNKRYSPEIINLWGNSYEMTLILRRNSKSSMRWDEKITLNFTYDSYRITFYNDKNNNWVIDSYEWVQYRDIDHKTETKVDRNQSIIYNRWNTETITLGSKSINHSWVRSIELELYFN